MQLTVAERAQTIIDSGDRASFFAKLSRRLASFLERYFGAEILVKLPADLYGADLALRKPTAVAEKLQARGIISRVMRGEKAPDEPFIHLYWTLSDATREKGSGVDFFDAADALWRAVAEATERYLWADADEPLAKVVRKSHGTVKEEAVDIFSLAGFSDEQKNKEDSLRFDEHSSFGWIPVSSLTEGKNVLCPAQLVSRKYFHENVKTPYRTQNAEPMLRWVITTGLATGTSYEEAATKGFLEVIERDTFMISFLNGFAPPLLDLGHLRNEDGELRDIFESIERYNLEIHLVKPITDFPVEAVFAFVIDRTGKGPALTVGGAANFDLKAAILSALGESLHSRSGCRLRFDKKVDVKNTPREARLAYWMDINNLPKLDFFLRGETIRPRLSMNLFGARHDRDYYKERLAGLRQAFKEKGYKAYMVELTPKDLSRETGFRTVMTIVPELQPLHLDERIPYRGGKRLSTVPAQFGLTPAAKVNDVLHPFP